MALPSELVQKMPIRVNWRGFQSDTYTLASSGWEVRRDVENRWDLHNNIWIRIIDPQKRIMISGYIDTSQTLRLGAAFWSATATLRIEHSLDMLTISDKVVIFEDSRRRFDSMATAELTDGLLHVPISQDGYVRNLPYMGKKGSKLIYLPEANVDQCLNQILKLQYKDKPEFTKEDKISSRIELLAVA